MQTTLIFLPAITVIRGIFFTEDNLCIISDCKNYNQSPGSVLWKGVPKNFAKFTGKHLCQSLFFNEVAVQFFLIKKETLVQVFSCKFCEILRTPFFNEHPGGCFWRIISTTNSTNLQTTKIFFSNTINALCSSEKSLQIKHLKQLTFTNTCSFFSWFTPEILNSCFKRHIGSSLFC